MGRLSGPAKANVSCAQTKRSGKASDGREMATTCYMAPRSCMTHAHTRTHAHAHARARVGLHVGLRLGGCLPSAPGGGSRTCVPLLVLSAGAASLLSSSSSSPSSLPPSSPSAFPPLPPSSNPVYLSPAVFHSSPSLPLISPLGRRSCPRHSLPLCPSPPFAAAPSSISLPQKLNS